MRAEPRAIGTARARDPLAREVKLLGALLGQVIVEQEGARLLAQVEAIRRRTIALRATADDGLRIRLGDELAAAFDALTVDDTEAVIRAFALYFQLVNVAEERARVRGIRGRRRSARGAVTRGSVGEALLRLEATGTDPLRAPRPSRHRARPDGPSDRGTAADRDHRPASRRAPGRTAP